MRIVIYSLLLLQITVVSGQKILGVVSDKRTNEPLPYVHIGVAGKNLGVISRDDGSFEIDLTPADRQDKLVYSIIGYQTRTFSVADVRPGQMDVRLEPKVYQLREVVIRPADAPTVKLGRYEPSDWNEGQSGKTEFGFGGEWGLRIFNDGKRYFIDDVRFHLAFNTVDSILFRINMYEVTADMPGESILLREIFAKAYKKQKVIIRDLVKENITMDQDLIVTYEVVRVWFSKRGPNQIFFAHGKGYEQGRTYYRASSQDAWTLDQHQPCTLYLTVEEY